MPDTDTSKQTVAELREVIDSTTDPAVLDQLEASEGPEGRTTLLQAIERRRGELAEGADEEDQSEEDAEDKKAEAREQVMVSVAGEHAVPLQRADGENEPTTTPRCQEPGCGSALTESVKTQTTANAGTVTSFKCETCGATGWWRSSQAWQYVGDSLQF